MRLLDGCSRAGAVRLTGVLFASLVVAGACLGTPTALASGVWSAPTKIGIRTGSVSCPSATFCVAVGGPDPGGDYSVALTYNGTSWSAPTILLPGGALTSVSCSSATLCVAVGNVVGAKDTQRGFALTYNGTSWSAPTQIGGNSGLGPVSCSSATFCAVVGNFGAVGAEVAKALTYNGTSWSAPTQIESDGGRTMSCSSATFCLSLDGESALTYNGMSWSAPTKTAALINPSVSCSSATFCAAVGQNGDALTYNGTSWSAPTLIDGGGRALTYPGLSVSCPSATFCVAVDTNGNAETYNGTSWSAPTHVIGTVRELGLWSVSCPSATFCVATGLGVQGGIALTYTTATAPEASASVKIEKFKVTTSSLVLTIKTSRAGTVTITGPGLKKTTRTVAVGTHVMTVALTKAGKAERAGRKKIKLSVSLKTSIKTVSRSAEIKL
jgi:hypothetical protein